MNLRSVWDTQQYTVFILLFSLCVCSEESGPQELELQAAAGNPTWVLHKSRRYSLLLSHLFTFLNIFFCIYLLYVLGGG